MLKKIAKYIQEQNEKIYAPLGLLLTDPIERGLRVVSFLQFSDLTELLILISFFIIQQGYIKLVKSDIETCLISQCNLVFHSLF